MENSKAVNFKDITYQRRKTTEVNISGICMGADNPIRIQTMTNTKTTDTKATVEQIIRCINAGSVYIRLAVPKPSDIENIKHIKIELSERGHSIPIVADVHFNAKLALKAAAIADKVRINPGNYVDKKRLQEIEYTPEGYQKELQKVEDELIPLINLCKKNGVALRIGTNHGSLSDRIMSSFGDTPQGMSESCMEFLRILKKHNFNNIVISMKASNTRIMVYATRLLVRQMEKENMHYPIHLGVTEAGEGEDGRIKSAAGIGALLMQGIGDTIRVSLTEEPEAELPVAKKIVDYVASIKNHEPVKSIEIKEIPATDYNRRLTNQVENIGGNHVPVVLLNYNGNEALDPLPDYTLQFENNKKTLTSPDTSLQNAIWVNSTDKLLETDSNTLVFFNIKCKALNKRVIEQINAIRNIAVVIESDNANTYLDLKSAIQQLTYYECKAPLIVKLNYRENNLENLQLKASVDCGALFIDGLCDGIFINNNGNLSAGEINKTAFGILQATRVRTSKTEYISCPSCGRTLFNLQETTRAIREKTIHLKELKIGVMGCIVNGIGEMADADYGYVGAGPGKVSLYKNKILVKKNIPQEQAVNALVDLIKENGDWKEQT